MSAAGSRPCDFCKTEIAPFGFAPAPHYGVSVRRPIQTCADPECQAKAEDRVQALVLKHNPFDRPAAGEARPASAKDPQGSLF